MPVQVNYLKDGVEFVASGVVTGEEIIEANEKVYSSADLLRRIRYKLVDRSAITDYQVTPSEIMKIAGQDIAASKINPEIVVLLVSSTSLQFGMSRMYQVYVTESGFRVEIFKDRRSADAWLEYHFSTEKSFEGEIDGLQSTG